MDYMQKIKRNQLALHENTVYIDEFVPNKADIGNFQ